MVFTNRAASKVTKNLREISIFLVGNMDVLRAVISLPGSTRWSDGASGRASAGRWHASVLGGEPWGGRA